MYSLRERNKINFPKNTVNTMSDYAENNFVQSINEPLKLLDYTHTMEAKVYFYTDGWGFLRNIRTKMHQLYYKNPQLRARQPWPGHLFH